MTTTLFQPQFLRVGAAAALALSLSACATFGGGTPEEIVAKRAQAYWDARIKGDVGQVRDEARIEAIVQRVRERTVLEGGQPDVMEAVYRQLMEECIAYEHREFARLRGTHNQEV